jgi:hypothetical protein
MAAVATYLLAAVAKFRFGGLAWLNSATLAWAVVRRGTFIADPLAQAPWVCGSPSGASWPSRWPRH